MQENSRQKRKYNRTMAEFNVIIPARFQSSRLPGKMLLKLNGKPMLEHVYQCALNSGAKQVVIAVDDQRVMDVATTFADDVCMTSAKHPTGTDRLAEVVSRYQWPDDTIVVNLQGDEPLMPASLIQRVADNLQQSPAADIATLGVQISEDSELFDPNVVKVVCNRNSEALYFSRAVIPWHRDQFAESPGKLPDNSRHLRHLGLYAYRCRFLQQYSSLEPDYLEQVEALEQLRALAHGFRIHVGIADEMPGHGVDTEDDLKRVEELLLRSASESDI